MNIPVSYRKSSINPFVINESNEKLTDGRKTIRPKIHKNE